VANPYQVLSNRLSHDGSLAKSPYLLLAGVSTGEDEQNALIWGSAYGSKWD
jgi:hypothetical protein